MDKKHSAETARKIIAVLDEKKATNIKLLHVTEQTVIADYFVLSSGSSNTQIRALADEVEFRMNEAGIPCTRKEGYQTATWIVLDYDSVIVHIFNRDTRDLFKLEKLWADAEEIPLSLPE